MLVHVHVAALGASRRATAEIRLHSGRPADRNSWARDWAIVGGRGPANPPPLALPMQSRTCSTGGQVVARECNAATAALSRKESRRAFGRTRSARDARIGSNETLDLRRTDRYINRPNDTIVYRESSVLCYTSRH